jgi:hypothetical protein
VSLDRPAGRRRRDGAGDMQMDLREDLKGRRFVPDPKRGVPTTPGARGGEPSHVQSDLSDELHDVP